ncbi:uncharacterized protein LOC144312493 isoform X2 [Canis aureus]
MNLSRTDESSLSCIEGARKKVQDNLAVGANGVPYFPSTWFSIPLKASLQGGQHIDSTVPRITQRSSWRDMCTRMLAAALPTVAKMGKKQPRETLNMPQCADLWEYKHKLKSWETSRGTWAIQTDWWYNAR